MPSIRILEDDQTKGTGSAISDVAFIIGFSSIYDGDNEAFAVPHFCASVADFENFAGTDPYEFETSQTYQTYTLPADSLDLSYIMAKELLSAGMPIIYFACNPTDGLSGLYSKLSSILGDDEVLRDKNEYTFKYITSGAYPNIFIDSTTLKDTTIATSMLACAKDRGDAVALIQANTTSSTKHSDFLELIQNCNIFNTDGTYGTMFHPSGIFNLTGDYTKTIDASTSASEKVSQASLPGSFGYLLDLADNMKTSPNYFAFAGINRGIVPNLSRLDTAATNRFSNNLANKFQPTTAQDGVRAINGITDIKPYGLTIWGNRTLATVGENGLTASNFLNVRNMVSDIKKVSYRAAKSLMFEQNNETLWINFKAEVTPLLEQLKSGGGISDYKLIKGTTTYTGKTLGKEEFACIIKIFPVYPVETFEIAVVISDSDVSVS